MIVLPTRRLINLGEIAYRGYCKSSGNKSLVSGADLPPFDQLKPEIQAAWVCSGVTLLQELRLVSESKAGWIGVDFDGTLCVYGVANAGDPVRSVVRYVRALLEAGYEVRVVTARVAPVLDEAGNLIDTSRDREEIERFCETHVGQKLPITHMKDYGMLCLIDDRAIQVQTNLGIRADGQEWKV